jgi:Uma2 family endonuclease
MHASAGQVAPDPTASPPIFPRPHRWTCEDYDRLIDSGALEGHRVELIDGTIVEMSPQRELHFAVIERVRLALTRSFGNDYWVRTQAPLEITATSKPEPDLAVVLGAPGDFDHHPDAADLVVEVSLTSLAYDLQDKASLYASGRIKDYWAVNVEARCVNVFREPIEDASTRHGFIYRLVNTYQPGQPIQPLNPASSSVDPAVFFSH